MAELDTGAVVGGHYVIVSLLGAGGMGTVYRARDTRDDSMCAIKVLREARGDLAARFVREARIAAALAHPNIAHVHEVLELDDGAPAIVMELLDGESLGARLARTGKLAPSAAARIATGVVAAIGAAHERGVIHRDLKPDNIFICHDGTVKVLDFGIAKVIENDDPAITAAALTDTGQILGTPQYMAPEQIFGEKDIDARADVWALGVILYHAIAGVRPFEGANPGQVFKAIALDPPTPLAERAPGTPKELTELVGKMLVHARAERLADLAEVARVLERVANDDLTEAPTLHASSVAARPSSSSRLIAIIALGATAAGAALVVALRPPSNDAPPALPVVAPAVVSSATAPAAPEPAPERAPEPKSAPAPPASAAAVSSAPAMARAAPRASASASAAVDAGAPRTNRSGPLKRDEF